MYYFIKIIIYSSLLFRDNKELVIIGVIGKSLDDECNKMAGFDMIKFTPEPNATVCNGQIRFYFNETSGKALYVHFQTSFDEMVMEQMLYERMEKAANDSSDVPSASSSTGRRGSKHRNSTIHSFHSFVRTKFAQILLFAIQVCHIIVLVETNNVFDTSYLSIFKALKVIR